MKLLNSENESRTIDIGDIVIIPAYDNHGFLVVNVKNSIFLVDLNGKSSMFYRREFRDTDALLTELLSIHNNISIFKNCYYGLELKKLEVEEV